ncbi:hypothetical protein [Calothrix sp. 336/3]|uniref:hypothetical protein n=1 Tax=Calothrix sp. 336/3 TaxID=1337936 RepID=UPI0004E2CD9D|nr:hypothetical protein [Calothrix sp. 336/3]AKG23705.1 hypothetical protein IJ00_22600 [Calothrix sp. 336/3]
MNRQLAKKILTIPVSLLTCLCAVTPAIALPGQDAEDVGAWIQAHPTLRPSRNEKFLINKTDTAAQRFTFQASVMPPGKIGVFTNRGKIRSERISIYDAINGMSFNRLQESLRIIYGMDIYQDFKRAQTVYEYPSSGQINSARFAKKPIQEALQGELRLGDRYAYWVEIAQPREGKAYIGQMTVLLKADLEKLQEELKVR